MKKPKYIKRITPENLQFSFEEIEIDFDMDVKLETPVKKVHITVMEKPKKVSDASTKLF